MASCSIKKVYAPNGNESLQFKKLRKLNANIEQSTSDINRNALEMWLIPYTSTFKAEYGDINDPAWVELNKDLFDENGEIKHEFYTSETFVSDPQTQREIDEKANRYIEADVKVAEASSDIAVQFARQARFLSRYAGEGDAQLKNLETLGRILKDAKGKGRVKAIINTATRDVLNNAALLKEWVEKPSTPKNRDATQYIHKKLMAYSGIDQLAKALKSNEVLAEQYKDELVVLKDLLEEMSQADQQYQTYIADAVADELSALSIKYTKDEILDFLKLNTVKTSKLTAAAIFAGDSADAVVALVAKYVQEHQDVARKKNIEFEHAINDVVDALEKEYGTTNAEKLYEPILEKKKGKFTGKLITGNAKQYREFLKKYEGTEIANALTVFKQKYTEVNNMLPESMRMGDRLPTIMKSNLERALASDDKVKGIISSVKEDWQASIFDEEVGERLDAFGQPIEAVPILYTGKYDPKVKLEEYNRLMSKGFEESTATMMAELKAEKALRANISLDVGNSLVAFASMAYNYSEVSKALFIAESSRDLVYLRTNVKLDAQGKPKVEKLTDFSGRYIRDTKAESNSYKMLDDYLQMQVYGKKEVEMGQTNVLGVTIDNRKVLKNISEYNSLLLMGGNVLAATSNINMGETMQWAEAWVGTHYTRKAYRSAHLEYGMAGADLIADTLKRTPSSKINLMNEFYDVLGDYRPDSAKTGETKFAKKVFTKGALLFMQSAGEHLMQSKAFMAFLKSTPTFDASGNETGNLWDSHEVKDGKLQMKEGDHYVKFNGEVVKYDSAQESRITRNAQAMLRRMHGNYNDKTAAGFQRNAVYGLIAQFRKWIPTGVQRRFGKKYHNEMADMEYEGNYRTTVRYLLEVAKDVKNLQSTAASKWHELSPTERANMFRTLHEAGMVIITSGALAILSSIAQGMDDDEYWYAKMQAMIYSTARLQNEMLAYTLPKDAMQLLRTPAVTINTAEAIGEFVTRSLTPWSWDNEYEAGRHKGEKKIQVSAGKIVPLYKQLDSLTRQGLEARVNFITQ